MNINSMENDTITVANLEIKHSSPVDSQQYTNSISDPVDDNETESEYITTNQKTLCWSKSRSCKGVCAFAIFTSLSITVGVLTVCLTLRKNTNNTCEITFERSAQRQIGYDSRPQHVAVGDFNNDGHQDIVVANSGSDNVGIFLNYGNGTFTSQITYSTGVGSSPYSVAVEDLNKDNNLDIVVANYGSHSIGVLLGYGNGHFANQTTISLGSARPLALAIGTLNKDDQLDIAVVNYGTSTVTILIGYNNGSFRIETIYDMGYDSIPYSLIIADFNNDNQFDIAVVNYGTSNLAILMANENGTFESKTYLTGKGSHPSSIAVGDFNKDNRLDIAIANSGTDNIGIFLGYENGTFINMIPFLTGSNSHPKFIAVYDFNNDTHLDIVVVNSENEKITIFKGVGNGSFSLLMTHSTGLNSDPCSIAIADFDNDKKPDIAITNNGTDSILILTAYALYPVTSQMTYLTGVNSEPYSVAVGDFNNDNHLDIAVANSKSNNIGVFINFGNGTFKNLQIYDTEKGSKEQFISIGDFNNDNQLDIVFLMSGVSKIGILLGYGNGSFRYGNMYSTGIDSTPNSINVGDFNNDKYLDIVTANTYNNSVGIFLNYGNGTFTNVITSLIKNDSTPTSVGVGDFNSDNILDIVTADAGSNDIAILLGFGNGSFLLSMFISTGDDNPTSVAIGDINNDHRLDIVYCSPVPSNVGVILGYGNGSYGSITKYSTGDGSLSWSVILGDFNNDTLLDIVVANVFAYNIGIFVGFGNGSFAAQKTFSTGFFSFPYYLAFGDFNNDKQQDIVVSNRYANNVVVFLVYYDVDFATETSYTTGSGSHPYSVAVGDFNNDNHLDIVVANSGNDNIEIFLGYDKGTFMNKVTYSTGFNSRPQFVTTADFNKDNRLDIVVANFRNDVINIFLGLGNGTFNTATTHSTGPRSSPSSIAVSDFNNDSWTDIAVANQGTNEIAVFIAFDYITFTNYTIYIPEILPFPSYIVAGDFNNDHQCDIVVANSNTNNIGIYLGYGNGTFGKQISHSTGPLSAPISIAVDDFNNDSQLDIVVANSGTNNIGIFLGDGSGSFGSQITYETGNSSSPVSVAIGDFNKDNISDIVVANRDTDNIGIFLGYGNGTFAGQISYAMPTGSSPVWVTVNDFNNDHILDIVVANINANNIGILFGYSNGTFKNVISYSTGNNSSPCSVAVGDFNKDSWMDIVVANRNEFTIAIYFGSSNGVLELEFKSERFVTPWRFSTGNGSLPSSVAVGDFNDDHQIDIAVANSGTNNIGILLGRGGGTFNQQKTYSIGKNSGPVSITVGYINNDNQLDIAVANSNSNTICILFGYKNESFAVITTYSTGISSAPSSIISDDLNKDNHTDIVVITSGTNKILVFLGMGNGTLLSPKSYSIDYNAHPQSVAIGDLNNDNLLDVVVANFGADYVEILLRTC
ncbi:unnamed protein product [Rotaria sordida]|uniref:Uncharacterized protein n=1 Tax=Rotaria sordida TaxID=392033 RepID=A0A814UJ82_9BILA|nr:unnamed protein product [Rotaria sordida]